MLKKMLLFDKIQTILKKRFLIIYHQGGLKEEFT